ncbi:MAG TPA: hypothetical protein VNS29_14605 [Burkholderiaceae bacterium]|nr:hypothetical protein [Burkholderiaceae bacterium]
MPYFTEIATNEAPDAAQLHDFLKAARRFLHDLLNNELRLDQPRPDVPPPIFAELRGDALGVFQEYVQGRFEQLHRAVDEADPDALRRAGLTGQPQYLKLRTLAQLEQSPGDEGAYWPRVINMTDQVDTILESILDLLKSLVPGMDGYMVLFREYRATLLAMLRG